MTATALTQRVLLAVIPLLVVAPLIHWFALGPRVPEGTFLLISQLSGAVPQDDPSNIIYSFARPPIYAALGWIWANPRALLLTGFLGHMAFNACVFVLAYLACRDVRATVVPRWAVAVVLASLVFPVGNLGHLVGHGTSLVPHDAYYAFSFRTFAFTFVAIGYCCLVTKRLHWALWAVAASCYMHPTVGLIAFVLFSGAVGMLVPREQRIRLTVVWIAAALVALAPSLWKLYAVPLPPDLGVEMSYGEWYSQMIKNEADDFSVLYQIAILPKTIVAYYALIAGVLFAYARVFADFRRDPSFWFAAAIPVLYIIAGITEYVFAVLVPTPIIRPLVTLTIGYRLLSFAFFPLVVLVARLTLVGTETLWRALRAADRFPGHLRRLSPGVAAVLVVLIAWSLYLATGIASGRTAAALSYAAWALSSGRVPGIDAYLLAYSRVAGDQKLGPDLFVVEAPVLTYPGERNVFRIHALDKSQPGRVPDQESLNFLSIKGFAEFIAAVRRHIPPGEGVIIPPYVAFFRDALPDYRIYFQEHHDGNLMLGDPRFAKFWTRRMVDLMGFDYEGMPSKYSGLNSTQMRSAYLAIDGSHVEKLHSRYPSFRYLVTEKAHALPYEPAFGENGFIVYDLERPTGRR